MNEEREVDGPAHPVDPAAGASPGQPAPAPDAERSTADAGRKPGDVTDARPSFTTETGADKD